jgi:pheromone shutdown protein TraB
LAAQRNAGRDRRQVSTEALRADRVSALSAIRSPDHEVGGINDTVVAVVGTGHVSGLGQVLDPAVPAVAGDLRRGREPVANAARLARALTHLALISAAYNLDRQLG